MIRSLLVPALVSLFGAQNWWLPPWAARILRVVPSPLNAAQPSATAQPSAPIAGDLEPASA